MSIAPLSRALVAAVLFLAGGEAARGETWKSVRQLPAPEANQAAAADERYLYAITNDRVVVFDRATDARVSESRGDAKHLNSGFVWDGVLYAAHSNYPKTPESSQIKRFDPATGELTTFHDFGNYGGSLTWAIHQPKRAPDEWWCNFAKYGEHNVETFLVRFDADWKELARFTYPPELFGRLGKFSLSGGIWTDDTLLVTGHDDRMAFRLRLPAAGTVLEFVEEVPIPFTGQGIAADPVTGGLVGIDRGRKRVLVAESERLAARRLRVLTYNIHHGEGTDGKLDLDRIAEVIRVSAADIVCLQEVDRNVTRSGRVDQPAVLGKALGFHVAFGGNLSLQGGEYGNALLSRYPVARFENVLLPVISKGEQRGVLEAEIAVPLVAAPVRIFATHLDHRRDDAERRASMQVINDHAAKAGNAFAILAGDLNDDRGSETLAAVSSRWTLCGDREIPSIPSDQPKQQIDFVAYRPAAACRVVETRVIAEPVASDHRPVLTILEFADTP